MIGEEPVDEKPVELDEADKADAAASDVIPEEAFDKALVDLDVDVPNPKVDDATWQEVATKLDLAGAYVEIGDADGAIRAVDVILRMLRGHGQIITNHKR